MISFAWISVLLCLPLPFIVGFILPPIITGQSTALKVPFFPHLLTLGESRRVSHKPRVLFRVWAYIIWTLLVVAAARPTYIGEGIPVDDQARAVMMAVDLSGSMQELDMQYKGVKYSRLDTVKQVATEFIRRRQGDRIGLVLFGTQAYLRTPLTFDRDTVSQMLKEAEVGLAGEKTALGDAIGLTLKRLHPFKADEKVLILLTDGRNNAGVMPPLKAAQLAKAMGVRIYTIGLGAESQLVNTPFGRMRAMTSDGGPDHTMLTEIAEMTGGRYFKAQNPEDLAHVYEDLDALEPVKLDDRMYFPKTELYPYPLFLALCAAWALFWMMRRQPC